MNFRLITVGIAFFVGIQAQASIQPTWKHGDTQCPEENESERYIEVPLFHDLKNIARVDRIPGLNTHDNLRENFEGAKINLFYELLNGWSDQKELLIFIPGGPGQPHADLHGIVEIYKQTVPEFLEKFNLIAMDHRGVGCSKPLFPGIEPYQSLYMRQAASDIDLIRKELVGDSKIHVWGYSYGSILAQTYALLYPDNVDHLLLGGAVSSAEDFHLAGTIYLSNVLSAVPPRTSEAFMNLTEGNPMLREKVLDWAFPFLYSYLGRTELIPKKIDEAIFAIKQGEVERFEKSLLNGEWIIEWMMKSIGCGELFPVTTKYEGEYHLWKQMHSCKEFATVAEYFHYTDLLYQIQVPTLIYGGAFDHVTPAASMIKMAQRIPNSYIFIDPYLGHGIGEKGSCFTTMNDLFFSGASKDELERLARSPLCSGLPTLDPYQNDSNASPGQVRYYF